MDLENTYCGADAEAFGHAPANANGSGMENRVALGGFVNERLIARDHQGALRVQARAFGAVVADVEDDAAGQFALKIEIPDLHIAQGVVGIDGEIIGYGGLG